jgi:hypothetical protein
VGEGIELTGNAVLASTEALASLAQVGGDLLVERNDRLRDVTGLSRIEGVLGGGLYLRDNDLLERVEGFGALSLITGDFVLEGNAALQSVGGLGQRGSSPRVLGDILVADNDALTSLELPMPAGPQRGDVVVRNNAVLEAMRMLGQAGVRVRVRGELALRNNPRLEVFEGSELIEVVYGGLTLVKNAALGDLSMFQSLRTVAGELAVLGNDRLTDLDLPGLQSVGALVVTRNLSLARLDGLSGLSRVARELEVTGNPALHPCEVLVLQARLDGETRLEGCEDF